MKLKKFMKPIRSLGNRVMKPLDYRIVRKNSLIDYYLHEYESYEQYREIQIHHNKRKIKSVWADEVTLDRVAKILEEQSRGINVSGLCHGTRNGFEQNFLNQSYPYIRAIGTDISDTAKDYENSLQWDFHDERNDWVGAFDFVYSNSLDQSWKPRLALTTWLNQVKKGSVVIIEHTKGHAPLGASEMDPFGVRPVAMPYVLTEWFGDQIAITHSKAKKGNLDIDAWLFVCRKLVDTVQ